LASMDPDHKKRLKEAKKLYERSMKEFKAGKITKDALKDRLRPYKFELRDLGYPVTIKEDEKPTEAAPTPTAVAPGEAAQVEGIEVAEMPIDATPWKRSSALTMEEIERRIDLLSFERNPSDSLRKIYRARYGEELAAPVESIPQAPPTEGEAPSAPSAPEPAAPSAELAPAEKRPFWRSMFKSSKEGK